MKMAVANMSTSCAECTTGKRDWSFWDLTALMFLTFSLCCLSYVLYLFADVVESVCVLKVESFMKFRSQNIHNCVCITL